MDRRDFAKKAVALGLAPIVVPPGKFLVPRTDRPARLVWVGLCRNVDMDRGSSLPSVDDYCAQQRSHGRHILATIQKADELGLVAVGEDYWSDAGALRAMQDMVRRICEPDADEYYHYGTVWAVAHVAPGEALDVQAFLRSKDESYGRGLESRIGRLERDARGAE